MKKNHTLSWIVFTIIAISVFVPFAWLVRVSLTPEQSLNQWPPTYLPPAITLINYTDVLTDGRFWQQLGNSLFLCLFATGLALAFGIAGAYGLARYRFRGRNGLFLALMGLHLVPGVSNMTALYRTADLLHALNSLLFVAVLKAGGVMVAIWILYSTFKNVPENLEQAAMLDGNSRAEALMKVTLPLAGPGILTAGLLLFIQSWNTFLLPFLLLTKPSKMTLTVGLYRYFTEHGFQQAHVAAFLTLSLLPVFILFLIFRNRLWRNVEI